MIAWQTWVVGALTLANVALALIVGNEPALGINAPWLTIVIIPTTVAGVTLAANQLKSIGAQAPNTTTETKTTTVTPAPPPAP